jgi:hypothetical protein
MREFGGNNPEAAMEQKPEKKEEIDEILSKAVVDRKEMLAERRKELEMAKVEQKEKEPFDIQKLAEYYDLTDDHGKLRVSPERIERLEMEYYLDNPDAKTLKDFGERLTDSDAWSGG